MTEADARAWIADRFGAPSIDRLQLFADLLLAANQQQNLIAPSTSEAIWSRHLLDSAQLAHWGAADGLWLDIGSGGGLPGLVLAILLDRPFLLCEPRRLRATFLVHATEKLDLSHRVAIQQQKVETLQTAASTISARAVTTPAKLFNSARHCAHFDTCWILPRGKSGRAELEGLAMPRRAVFHVKQSLTDPDAVILLATGIGAA